MFGLFSLIIAMGSAFMRVRKRYVRFAGSDTGVVFENGLGWVHRPARPTFPGRFDGCDRFRRLFNPSFLSVFSDLVNRYFCESPPPHTFLGIRLTFYVTNAPFLL
jgi:hypothetical protein